MFGGEPLSMPEVGLVMKVPTTAKATVTQIGPNVQGVVDNAAPPFITTITTHRTEALDATVVDVANFILARLKNLEVRGVRASRLNDGRFFTTQALVRTDHTLLFPENLDITVDRQPNLKLAEVTEPAERFYYSFPTQDGDMVRGYTIFRPIPGQFVVMEMLTSRAKWTEARSAYEVMVATTRFQDTAALANSRRDAVNTAARWLSQLTPGDYLAAMPVNAEGKPAEQWFRLARRLPPGAKSVPGIDPRQTSDGFEEVGFRSVRFWKGRRSEVGGGTATGRDDPEGFLVRIEARILTPLPAPAAGEAGQPAAPGQPGQPGLPPGRRMRVVDTISTAFMTPDRQEESWLVQTTLRDAAGRQTWSETGARRGGSMQVVTQEGKRPPRNTIPQFIGDGYITQFEVQLLPRLLARAQLHTDFGFYAWRSDAGTLSLRRESVTRQPGAGDALIVRTRFRDTDEPQVGIYAARGDLLSLTLPDGAAWEPATRRDIVELWTAKGLPID